MKGNYLQTPMEHYLAFHSWLDRVLDQELPSEIETWRFNLSHGEIPGHYQVILSGSRDFDPRIEGWTANDDWSDLQNSSRFQFDMGPVADWDQTLTEMDHLLRRYLKVGKHANKLKRSTAVGVGLTNGSMELVYTAR